MVPPEHVATGRRRIGHAGLVAAARRGRLPARTGASEEELGDVALGKVARLAGDADVGTLDVDSRLFPVRYGVL